MKPIEIQSGLIYADESMQGWTLHRGKGDRIYKGFVKFSQPFDLIPYVMLSLYEEEDDEVEVTEEAEIPVECTVTAVSNQGFEFCFQTWSNHHISNITARWVAMAQK